MGTEYSISVAGDGSYIVLRIEGEIDRAWAMARNLEAHARGLELGIAKYLVDVTGAVNTDTVIDSYYFAYEDMRDAPGIDRAARVAVLASPDDHSHDFIETVARNSGLDVRLFRDRDQALRHLREP